MSNDGGIEEMRERVEIQNRLRLCSWHLVSKVTMPCSYMVSILSF